MLSVVGAAAGIGGITRGALAGAAVGASGGAVSAVSGMVLGAVGEMIRQKIIGKAFEKGEDEFVSYASGLGKTEKEMEEFADAAAKLFDLTVMAGAVAGMAKDGGKKRIGLAPKTPRKTARTVATAAGMAKGALGGPNPKLTKAPKASKSSATVREAELVGTGLKVKVPVEEVPSSAVPALAKARKGDGKGGTGKASKAKQVEQPTTKRIEVDVDNFFNNMKKDKNWRFHRKYKGKPTYKHGKTEEIRYGDRTPNFCEIECFTKNGEHIVLDPVTGEKILPKCGKHRLPNCLK